MKNITFVNAGAGSGKTYRLTTDLARMLTQEGLDPSQVILTTYTELAAAEFREKARKEILNAKDKDNNPIEANKRIKSATQLDNAFIGTVHAISYRFIRKYWYLLSYGADIQPMSDQNQDFYMSQSISNIASDNDRKVFRKFRDAFDLNDNYGHPYHLFWLPELKTIVDKMEYYDIQDTKESIEQSIATAKKVYKGRSFDECFKTINAFLPQFKTYLEGIQTKGSAGYQNTLESINYKVSNISDLKTDGLKDCLTKQIGSQAQKAGFYETEGYTQFLNAYNETFISKDYIPYIEEYLKTIFALAVRWQKALTAYKQENHIISFDDMEKIFLMMLTEDKYKEVQDDIAANFRLLMVDEFQDSNPIQLKIFNRISELIAKNGGHSVWVGDPKQAIYGFRGSDSRFIQQILDKFEFSEDGKAVPEQGDEKLGTDQLLQSWRSRPALVDYSNKIFLEPFLKSGLKEKQITLESHHTSKTDTMGKEQALYIWRTEQDGNDARYRMLASKIKELTESKRKVHHDACDKPVSDIDYRDIAVLCFSNANCNAIASALRKLGLPASCEESNLMQCREVYLLKTLLLFAQNPSDKMLRAELIMMLEDATTEDILKDRISYVNKANTEEKGWDKWIDSDSEHQYADIIAKMTEFTKRYETLSIYDAVVAIIEELDLYKTIEKWGDSTQRRHNLATVVNMAKAYDDMCCQMGIGSSILGFINYLSITKPDNKTDNSANTIKVLTYHRSKGLEWPVVILFDLWRDFDDQQDLAKKRFCGVNVCESEGQDCDIFSRKHYINLFPDGIAGGGNSNIPELMFTAIAGQEGDDDNNELKPLPLFDAIRSQTLEEALRLLYVGVTRAKDILVSVTSKKKESKSAKKTDEPYAPLKWPKSLGIGDGEIEAPFGKDLGETIEDLAESTIEDADKEVPQYRNTTNTPGVNSAPLRSLSPSTIKEFKGAFTKNEQVAEAEERIIDTKMFAGESSDAVKGSCIHNIFAAYEPNDYDGNIQRITQTLENYGFPNVLLQQKEKLIQSIEWLYDYLTKTYGPATRTEKECPLLYPLPSGQLLRGEIDLQWYYKDKNGAEKCILIDYKSFPGRRSELEAHTEKYYAQLSAYHEALTGAGVTVVDTLIYYPVQAHIRRLTR